MGTTAESSPKTVLVPGRRLGLLIHALIVALLAIPAAFALLAQPVDGEGVDLFGSLALVALTILGLPWSLPWNMFTPTSAGSALESPFVLLATSLASALANVLVHALLARRQAKRIPLPDKALS